MQYRVEVVQEVDGRWIAEFVALPGVMAYGETMEAAVDAAIALARRVLADRIEHREVPPSAEQFSVSVVTAAG